MATNVRVPPGPKGKPIIGSLPEFVRDPLGLFTDAWREHGDVLRFRVGPRTLYLVVNPEHLEHILVERPLAYPHPEWFDARIRSVLGHGVISMKGEVWHERRQALEPCLAPDRLPPLDEPFAAEIAAELERWRPNAQAGRPRVVKDDVYDLSVRVLGRVLLGAAWERHAVAVAPSMRTFLDQIDRLLVMPFNVRPWVPLPANRRYLAARRRYEEAIDAAMGGATDSGGLLASLEELGRAHAGGDQRTFRNDLAHAYMAGWSTVAAAMMWSCYLLGLHPQVADRLRDESRAELGDRSPASADLDRMPYCTRVVNEVLRLYPPLWVIARSPIEDDEIGGYHIPAGAFVNFSSYLTHRHPDYWSDPEAFDPDRWLPERDEPRSPFAYLPFSHGPRGCPGEDVARTALRFFVPMLVQRYRLTTVLDHPITFTPGITLGSLHGVKVMVDPV